MTNLLLKTTNLFAIAFLLVACTPKSSEQGEEATSSESDTTSVVPTLPTYNITEDMSVSFVNIEDGAEVTSPFTMVMGVSGMELEPAGEYNENKGHHHLVIDGSFIPMYEVVPADENNIHYGDGRTETEVELSPGEHTLTLQFADGLHRSYGEQLSATITVTVSQ